MLYLSLAAVSGVAEGGRPTENNQSTAVTEAVTVIFETRTNRFSTMVYGRTKKIIWHTLRENLLWEHDGTTNNIE